MPQARGMHEELEELRRRIDELQRAADGRLRFTSGVRKDAIALARRWIGAGKPRTVLADALGIHKTTLSNWLTPRTKPRPKKVREVQVAEVVTGPTLTAVFPSGLRVEGLDVATVLELAKALS